MHKRSNKPSQKNSSLSIIIPPENKKEKSSQKEKKYIGKKIKRHLDEIKTTDNSIQNRESSKSDSLDEKIYESKNVINYLSVNNINDRRIRRIFSDYGEIKEIKMNNKRSGSIEFFNNKSINLVMKDKEKIFKVNQLSVTYNKNQLKKIEKKSKNLSIEEKEEFDNNKEGNVTEENYIGEGSSKNDNEENEDNNMESIEEDNENEQDNLFIDINKSKNDYNSNEELNKRINELERMIIAEKQKNEKYDKYIKENEKYKKKNEEDKKSFLKMIGVLCEINNQSEKYMKNNLKIKIHNLNNKLELILNSYKILYIRKISNILLGQLYDKYKESLVEKRVIKGYYVTISIEEIKGISIKNINLIIDFLKHIKIKASKIIHIEDEEIKFQKEILFVYLNRNPLDANEGKITLEDVVNIIFEKSKKKKKKKKERK